MSKEPKLEKVFLLGHVGTWSEIARKKQYRSTYVLLEHDTFGDMAEPVVVTFLSSGSFVVLEDMTWDSAAV